MAINKYNKYNVWRRYKSYDSGKTWVAMDDYEAFQTEENVESCGYIPVTYRWVTVDGTMCNTETHTLYSKTRQQASYDRGQTWDWTEPAVYNYGDVIEENSPQCGYPIYQWVTVKGATMCGSDEATKYNQYGVEKEQVSTDNGISWTDTGKQREGKMIENLSLKCGYVPEWKWEFTSISCGYKVPSNAQSAITRVTESTEYCENVKKYSRQNIELSTDNGATWSKTDEFKTTLLESASTECGYAEQWVTVEGEDFCGDGDSRYNKYHKEKKKVSYDSGVTWTDTDETRKGEAFEVMSIDCGYNDSVTVVAYTDGTYKYFDVEGSLGEDSLNVSDKSTIKKVIAGSKVTSIGNNAFRYCSSLTGVTIPSGVTSIGEEAFYECRSLTGITIPDGVTSIGRMAFSYCSSLTGITIPNSVTSIGYGAFYECRSLTGITIPDGVTSIGRMAFSYCSSLESVILPEGIKTIGDRAFEDCKTLTGITIPTGVTEIGNAAFSDCDSLTNITIPEGIKTIGNYVFQNCDKFSEMTVKATTPPTIGYDTFTGTHIQTIYVPSQSVDAYKASSGWSAYSDKIYPIGSAIPTMKVTYTDGSEKTFINLKKIDQYTDENKSNAKTVEIYDSVISIDNFAFYNSYNLTSVKISNSVTSIGYAAFWGCSGLTNVVIPNSVSSISESAFRDCSSLTGVTIPSGVTSISESAFRDCSSLTGITLPTGVTEIGMYAFQNCSSIQSIDIPTGVTTIGNYAFKGCNKLAQMTVKATTPPTIGYDTFTDTHIQTIYVPSQSVDAYKAASGWKVYAFRIQAIS